jgi:hypothetical protein
MIYSHRPVRFAAAANCSTVDGPPRHCTRTAFPVNVLETTSGFVIANQRPNLLPGVPLCGCAGLRYQLKLNANAFTSRSTALEPRTQCRARLRHVAGGRVNLPRLQPHEASSNAPHRSL